MRAKKHSTVAVTEVVSDHPVGEVVQIPPRDRERAEKQNEMIRALREALGEADFNVAVAETKRQELRLEVQKALTAQTEAMRIVAGRAGIDVEGPGNWLFDPKKMTFTRTA